MPRPDCAVLPATGWLPPARRRAGMPCPVMGLATSLAFVAATFGWYRTEQPAVRGGLLPSASDFPPAYPSCPALPAGGLGAFGLDGIAGLAVLMGTRGGHKTALRFGPVRFSAAILALFLAQPIVSSYRQLTAG